MRVTRLEIYKLNGPLQGLMKEKVDEKMNYRLDKIYRRAEPHFKDIEAKRRELIEKYADPQNEEEKAKGIMNVKSKLKEFTKEFDLWLAEEVGIDIEKIPLMIWTNNVQLSTVDYGVMKMILETSKE